MARALPVWAAYRLVVDKDGTGSLHLVGAVGAEFEHQAAHLARVLPDAPAYPVMCRAMKGTVPTIVDGDLPDAEPVALASRRSRRRQAFLAAATADRNEGRAA